MEISLSASSKSTALPRAVKKQTAFWGLKRKFSEKSSKFESGVVPLTLTNHKKCEFHIFCDTATMTLIIMFDKLINDRH